jgi:hypothetical protein
MYALSTFERVRIPSCRLSDDPAGFTGCGRHETRSTALGRHVRGTENRDISGQPRSSRSFPASTAVTRTAKWCTLLYDRNVATKPTASFDWPSQPHRSDSMEFMQSARSGKDSTAEVGEQ